MVGKIGSYDLTGVLFETLLGLSLNGSKGEIKIGLFY